MIKVFLLSCAVLLGLQYVIAVPFNNSEITRSSENDRCSCNHDIQELRERVTAIENSNNVRMTSDLPANIDSRALYPDVIGFTVTLLNSVSDLPIGSTVLYDDIFYNAGDGYDSSTGIFTCPRSGMYLFAIFVEGVKKVPTTELVLIINGNWRIAAVSEPYVDDHDTTGGNVLIQHIQAGDRVWVETYKSNNQNLYRGFTTFSGVLIQST